MIDDLNTASGDVPQMTSSALNSTVAKHPTPSKPSVVLPNLMISSASRKRSLDIALLLPPVQTLVNLVFGRTRTCAHKDGDTGTKYRILPYLLHNGSLN